MKSGTLGCILSSVDIRDYSFKKDIVRSNVYPSEYTIPMNLLIKSQGKVGACVAFALTSILEYYYKYKLSTNFIYGLRRLEGCDYLGKGMMLRDAVSIVHKHGDMLYDDCPGNTEVTKVFDEVEKCIDDKEKVERAKNFKISSYVRLNSEDEIKYSILNYGPVLASVRWYDTFTIDKTHKIVFDKKTSKGLHAIMIYGWDEDSWLCQNSWGIKWGYNGTFKVDRTNDELAEAYCIIPNEGTNNINIPTKNNDILDSIFKVLNLILNVIKRVLKSS